jgi:uncharacterized protein with NAD-binding domain and iron-sulfur cluster
VPSGKRVLVVGAGPSGLSAAYHLARLGHGVEIHEAGPVPGGMLHFGIPAYRLPRSESPTLECLSAATRKSPGTISRVRRARTRAGPDGRDSEAGAASVAGGSQRDKLASRPYDAQGLPPHHFRLLVQ